MEDRGWRGDIGTEELLMGLLAAAGGSGPGGQPAGGHLGPAGRYTMSCWGHTVPRVSFPGGSGWVSGKESAVAPG